MRALFWCFLAALGEIGGCSTALILFAMALTRIDSPFAGRAYAAYGGIYILCSPGWLWCVESVRPDRWDALGSLVCLLGAAVILRMPRGA